MEGRLIGVVAREPQAPTKAVLIYWMRGLYRLWLDTLVTKSGVGVSDERVVQAFDSIHWLPTTARSRSPRS
eukprot:1181566-Prorocentrum_minimum.AAC.3